MRAPFRSRLTAVLLAVVVAIGVPVTLSGCSIARNVVEGATGVDIGDGGIPDDFPTDQVPLIEGEVVFGGSGGTADARGWNVTVEVTDGTAFDTAKAALEAAGFAAGPAGGTDASGTSGTWLKEPYTVILVVSSIDDGTWVANYTVTATAPVETPSETPSETPAA